LTDPLAPPQPFTAPTPIDARFTPVQRRLIALAEVLLCSSVPTQLLIGALLGAAGWAPLTQKAGGEQLSLPFVLTLSLADTLVLIVLMVLLMRAHGESATELWVGRSRVRREVLVGVALVPLVFLMVVVLLNGLRLFAPWLHNVPTNPLEQLAGNTPAEAAMFALVGRRPRGTAARVSAAPVRAASWRRERRRDRLERGVRPRSRDAGLGCRDHDGRARILLGADLPRSSQQRRASRQPRRLQLTGDLQGRADRAIACGGAI
jgi:hypothetical protein